MQIEYITKLFFNYWTSFPFSYIIIGLLFHFLMEEDVTSPGYECVFTSNHLGHTMQ